MADLGKRLSVLFERGYVIDIITVRYKPSDEVLIEF